MFTNDVRSEIKPYPMTRLFLGSLLRRYAAQVNGLARLPLHTPFIIAANHIDFLDGFYLAYTLSDKVYRKVFFLSKTNNYFLFRTTIKVEPKEPNASLNAAINILRGGNCVCIFPEGQRNGTDVIGKGKTGVARLAMHTRLPLVPVGLQGPSASSFGGSILQLLRGKDQLTISIGEPITYWEYYRQEATPEIINKVTDHIMQSIAALAHKRYQP